MPFLLLPVSVVIVLNCSYPVLNANHVWFQTSPTTPFSLFFRSMVVDTVDTYWAIFMSPYYGFEEFWLCYSYDTKNWSKPIFTGIPAYPARYIWNISRNELILEEIEGSRVTDLPFYRRASVAEEEKIEIPIPDLLADADLDGLPDLAEEALWTNPRNSDTDGDGKADGYDDNPLAAPADSLSDAERLHKFIIESELAVFDSDQLVLVEQFGERPMEYRRAEGLVLSMPPDTLDAFVDVFGFGVPILTADVKDTLKNKYKVSFQFFVSPDSAFGYDAIFKWVARDSTWMRTKELLNWEAVKEEI